MENPNPPFQFSMKFSGRCVLRMRFRYIVSPSANHTPMKHTYSFAKIICLAIFLCTQAADAQSVQYTGGSSVLISISDGQKSYEFTAPQIRGRFNNRLKRFEFLLGIQNVSTKQSGSFFMNLFNSIFHPDQSGELQMQVNLPSELRNFKGFANPQTLNLTGQIDIAGKTYQLPVTMSMKYGNGTLYYGLQGNVSSDFGIITASTGEKPVRPRQIQFIVRESLMGVYFEE